MAERPRSVEALEIEIRFAFKRSSDGGGDCLGSSSEFPGSAFDEQPGIPLLLAGNDLRDDHWGTCRESFLHGGTSSFADEKVASANEVRNLRRPSVNFDLAAQLTGKRLETASKRVRPSDRNRQRDVLKREKRPDDPWRQMVRGIHHV